MAGPHRALRGGVQQRESANARGHCAAVAGHEAVNVRAGVEHKRLLEQVHVRERHAIRDRDRAIGHTRLRGSELTHDGDHAELTSPSRLLDAAEHAKLRAQDPCPHCAHPSPKP